MKMRWRKQRVLHVIVAGTNDNVELLLTRNVDELNTLPGDADG